MNKIYVAILFTTICIAGMATSAHAQESEDTVVATVPHDFVADGVVLPKGTYRVSRLEFPSGARHLELRNIENGRATVLLMPTVFNESQTGKPQISFVHVGDSYFLSGIKTENGTYVLPLPKAFTSVAQVKDHGSVMSSGTN